MKKERSVEPRIGELSQWNKGAGEGTEVVLVKRQAGNKDHSGVVFARHGEADEELGDGVDVKGDKDAFFREGRPEDFLVRPVEKDAAPPIPQSHRFDRRLLFAQNPHEGRGHIFVEQKLQPKLDRRTAGDPVSGS